MHDFLQLPAYEKAKSLLETEKQQIIDAFEHSPKVITNEKGTLISIPGEQYYNETFKN